jgi:hypothetical protein
VSDEISHDDSADLGTPDDVETSNPVEGWGVNVLVPDLEVRMVNAGALEEYELWFGLSSVFAAAIVGFFVAYLQSFRTTAQGVQENDPTFLWVAILFLLLLLGAGIRTLLLRRRIQKKSRSYSMTVTAQRDR